MNKGVKAQLAEMLADPEKLRAYRLGLAMGMCIAVDPVRELFPAVLELDTKRALHAADLYVKALTGNLAAETDPDLS